MSSALARLSPKGRLVALLSDRFDPCSPRFAERFARLSKRPASSFTRPSTARCTSGMAPRRRPGFWCSTRKRRKFRNPSLVWTCDRARGAVRLVDDDVPNALRLRHPFRGRSQNVLCTKARRKPASVSFAAAALSAESLGGKPVTYQHKTSVEEQVALNRQAL